MLRIEQCSISKLRAEVAFGLIADTHLLLSISKRDINLLGLTLTFGEPENCLELLEYSLNAV